MASIGVLDTDGKWMVGSSHLYIPSYDSTQIDHESIQGSDTGRTEDGVMHIDWVRHDVVKVYLKWNRLTGTEAQYIKSLMHGKEFTLTYDDAGTVKTANVYCTKVTFVKVTNAQYASDGGLCRDIQANCIEI